MSEGAAAPALQCRVHARGRTAYKQAFGKLNATGIPVIWSASILQVLMQQSTFRTLCDTFQNVPVAGQAD